MVGSEFLILAKTDWNSNLTNYVGKLNNSGKYEIKTTTAGTMLKIQMLEQIVTNDNVAEEKTNDDAEQSTSRTPINQSPKRNGLVFKCSKLFYIFATLIINKSQSQIDFIFGAIQ